VPDPYRVVGIVALLIVSAGCASSAAAGDVVVPAKDLSAKSRNITSDLSGWPGLTLCDGGNGFMEWTAEPGAGPRFVHFLYASGQRRPCQLLLNGEERVRHALGEMTGGFVAGNLVWKTYGPFEFNKGKNRIRLAARGNMPHLKGLVVSGNKKVPDPLVFGDPAAEAKAQQKADAEQTAATRKKLEQLLPGVDKILFVKRYTLQSTHYYTDFIDGCRNFGGNLCTLSLDDGTVTELVPDLAGGIFGRCNLSYDGRRVIFGYKPKLGKGFRIWEVGIDGKGLRQVTFDPPDEEQRVKKYRLSWHWGYMHHTDDIHPCYLPDGGIVFASSRCEFGILCDGRDILSTTVLYRMDADGKNMQQLTNSAVSESAPTIMNDGNILYTRWEYVDKGAVSVKCLWGMRPDGSVSEEVFGNDVNFPDTMNVGRAVPGSNHLVVCIGGPHMPLGLGTVLLIDTNKDLRTREPMTYITPDTDVRQEWGYNHFIGGRWVRDSKGPLYMDPYPISEEWFLIAHNPDRPWNDTKAYGLYLLGTDGKAELFYRDPEISCWMPIPVRARPKPPVPHSTFDPELAEKNLARVIVADVYRGLEDTEPGSIRYIRVLEQVPRSWKARRFWDGDTYDQQHSVVSKDTHLGLKVMHGIVPVEEDGSAHFTVPADKNIFFQALDKDYMAVQSERTYVNYRPGETRGCVGCHEKTKDTPGFESHSLMAMRHPAVAPGPQPGDKTAGRPLHYPSDVQPVLDRHCVRCHDGEKTKAKIDLRGTPTRHFNVSYENMLRHKLVKVIGENHPKTGNVHYVPARGLYAHASKLLALLREGHEDVKLSPEEWVRLVTWVDSNAQYYGSYFGRKNLTHKDHPNFRPVPTYESACGIPPLNEEDR